MADFFPNYAKKSTETRNKDTSFARISAEEKEREISFLITNQLQSKKLARVSKDPRRVHDAMLFWLFNRRTKPKKRKKKEKKRKEKIY